MAKKSKGKVCNCVFKRLVALVASVVVFVMTLLTKVTVSNTTTVRGTKTTIKADPIGFFEFMDKAKDAEIFGTARTLMLIGFILITVVMAYFLLTFIIALLGNKKVMGKLGTLNVVLSLVLVVGTVLVLAAGLDKNVILKDLNYSTISLFGTTWIVAMVCSLIPATCEFVIKK